MPFTGGPLILENIKKTVRKKVRWGVLGAAKIAIDKVIPAMQQGELTEVTAIASRDLGKAQTAARQLGIARAYGSYEELLASTENRSDL